MDWHVTYQSQAYSDDDDAVDQHRRLGNDVALVPVTLQNPSRRDEEEHRVVWGTVRRSLAWESWRCGLRDTSWNR